MRRTEVSFRSGVEGRGATICPEHASGVSGGVAVRCLSAVGSREGPSGRVEKIVKKARVQANRRRTLPRVDFVNHRRAAVNGRERFPLHTSRMRLRGEGGRIWCGFGPLLGAGWGGGGGGGGETGTHLRRRGRPRPGYFLAIRGIAGLARTVGSVVARGRSASRCGLRERVCRNVPRRGAEVHLAVDVDANGGGLDARGFALSLTLERRGSASGLHVDETERGRRGRGDTRATSRPSRDALTNGRRGKKCVRVRVTAHDLVRTSPCRFCVRCRNASGYLDSR